MHLVALIRPFEVSIHLAPVALDSIGFVNTHEKFDIHLWLLELDYSALSCTWKRQPLAEAVSMDMSAFT